MIVAGFERAARFLWTRTFPWETTLFFRSQNWGNFGIFLDSSPDRWGQTLMKPS